MKKYIFFAAFLIAVLSYESKAQTNFTISIDSTFYKDYVGKYKFKEAPFETVVLSTVNGRLIGNAGEAGRTELSMTEIKDEFEIREFDGTCKFQRDERGIIVKVIISVNGDTFEGEKIE